MSGLVMGLLAGCATPTARDEAAAQTFIEQVETLRVAQRIPGLAVVVLRGTNTVLARGLGLADVAKGTPVTADTLFDIASVSKTISGVVALRLAERGLLNLDASLASFTGFEAFCDSARRAGGLFYRDFECDTQPPTLRQVLGMASNGTPGTRFFYNPPVYSWASRPMAQAGGAAFSDLVAREVFVPAGMASAARIHRGQPLPAALQARLAQPYHLDAQGVLQASPLPPPQGDGASGGVVCSALDLARLDVALTEGRLLTPASQQAMWTAGRSPAGTTLPYGIGWYVQTLAGETLLWHGGLWEGAWSALYLKLPARNLTLILLANSDGLRWTQGLDEAAAQNSPFVRAALAAFAR